MAEATLQMEANLQRLREKAGATLFPEAVVEHQNKERVVVNYKAAKAAKYHGALIHAITT